MGTQKQSQPQNDKIYLYAKDLSELKYEFLIKKRENAGTKHLNDPNAFIECSNTMDDVYGNWSQKGKSVNAQLLNKNLSDLNHQSVQYKEGYTEFDNFIQFLGKVRYSYATCALTIICNNSQNNWD